MPSRIEWKADAGGRVTHVTRGWQDVTGQPVDDALGDGWGDVIHPADLGTLAARWQEDVGRGVPFAATFRVLTRTGDAVWMESHGSPITRDGRVVEWVGWCSPIPNFAQGAATVAVNGHGKTSGMTNRGVEYLVIGDDGTVAMRTTDAGEARAYYLGAERTVDVFTTRLKWGVIQKEIPASGIPDRSRTAPDAFLE